MGKLKLNSIVYNTHTGRHMHRGALMRLDAALESVLWDLWRHNPNYLNTEVLNGNCFHARYATSGRTLWSPDSLLEP